MAQAAVHPPRPTSRVAIVTGREKGIVHRDLFAACNTLVSHNWHLAVDGLAPVNKTAVGRARMIDVPEGVRWRCAPCIARHNGETPIEIHAKTVCPGDNFAVGESVQAQLA